MVSMSSPLILFKNEGFLMFWDALERFGVDLKSKFFHRFFMIFVTTAFFFFSCCGRCWKKFFLRNKVYFDVHFHFPACKFACGVVFCNDTDGLPGKNTTKIKGLFNEQNFFRCKSIFEADFLLEIVSFVCYACILCMIDAFYARFLSLVCVFLR